MKRSTLKQGFQISAIFLISAVLSGFAGCGTSLSSVCDSQLPELDQKVESAIAALTPWVDPGRDLASSSYGADTEPLAPMDQRAWKKWAEGRLVEAQRFMDAVADPRVPGGRSSRSQVREELSEIATALVSFHGYATQGKSKRMVRTLERIRAHVAKARSLVCPASSG